MNLKELQDAAIKELRTQSLSFVGAYFAKRTEHMNKSHIARILGVTAPAVHKYRLTMTYDRCKEILSLLDMTCPSLEELMGMDRTQAVIFQGEAVTGTRSRLNEHVTLVEREDIVAKVHTASHTLLSVYRKSKK